MTTKSGHLPRRQTKDLALLAKKRITPTKEQYVPIPPHIHTSNKFVLCTGG
jgi:hypothetical protein